MKVKLKDFYVSNSYDIDDPVVYTIKELVDNHKSDVLNLYLADNNKTKSVYFPPIMENCIQYEELEITGEYIKINILNGIVLTFSFV